MKYMVERTCFHVRSLTQSQAEKQQMSDVFVFLRKVIGVASPTNQGSALSVTYVQNTA